MEKNGQRTACYQRRGGSTSADVWNHGKELADLDLKMEVFASKGYRIIAVALSQQEAKMQLAGLVALYDQPRPDSAKIIAKLRAFGISVKMLTGDLLPIAKQVAEEVI